MDLGNEKTTVRIIAYLKDDRKGFDINIELTDKRILYPISREEVWMKFDEFVDDHPFRRFIKCQSPIELDFLVGSLQKIEGLKPQVEEGPYKIDLAHPEKKIAIELDGHDFHKTRSQRTNDAKRERYLQMKGWKVIRFTGTEIYNDLLGCIDEAVTIINKENISIK
jgi:very-short-patch-repair endonuclease